MEPLRKSFVEFIVVLRRSEPGEKMDSKSLNVNTSGLKVSADSDKPVERPKLDANVYLTEAAIAEIKRRLSAEPGGETKLLRLRVEAGGCSGLSYEMDFVTEKGKMDREYNFDGLTVIVDARSLLYIGGMTLDFSTKMVNGGFQFQNPKAKRSCGCGTSFSV
jgi:iron-sulfur cluster assembly protein